MNILFFLSPKQDLMYVYDDFTLRQTLEKWENNRYASIPVLNRQGKYVGTLTEGDILWGLKKYHGLDLEAAEDVPISAFPHKRASSSASCGGRPSSGIATIRPVLSSTRKNTFWNMRQPIEKGKLRHAIL